MIEKLAQHLPIGLPLTTINHDAFRNEVAIIILGEVFQNSYGGW